MTTQEKLIKSKLSILELAEYLKNVSQACKINGVSRQHFYDIKKAYEETQHPYTTVVMLIPARTDTSYWHEYVTKASHIHYIRGRIKFKNSAKGGNNPAPFPSAVVVFGGWTKWIS